MRRTTTTTLLTCLLCMAFGLNLQAQTKVQRGVARMITRSLTDPIVPVAGVQVVVGNVASKASDGSGRFSLNVSLNSEQSYQLADVRVPKNSKLALASPSRKKKLFLDKNQLEVALISQDEKNMVSRANYKTLLRKYNEQAERVRQLREQLEARQAELDANSEEYRIVTAKRDSVQALLNLYFDDKTYEQTLKDIESIAEDLALTDYQSLDSIEARIYELKMAGDWSTISDLLIRLMGGNASAWLHDKLDRRNEAAKDFAMGMEMIKEAIEAFKMQHLNDSVSYYYEILVKADSTNWDCVTDAIFFEYKYTANFAKARKYCDMTVGHVLSDSLQSEIYRYRGQICIEEGRYKESLGFFRKSLSLKKEALGKEHWLVFTDYGNLSTAYFSLGDYDRALQYGKMSLNGRISRLGINHVRVADSYLKMGTIYSAMHYEYKALTYYAQALDLYRSLYGENNEHLSGCYIGIAEAYLNVGRYDSAHIYLSKAFETDSLVYGPNHPNIADDIGVLGNLYFYQGKYAEAMAQCRKALGIYRNAYGDRHDMVGVTYELMANLHMQVGNYAEALSMEKKANDIFVEVFGTQNFKKAFSDILIGLILQRLGRSDEALVYMEKALRIYGTGELDEVNLDRKALAYGVVAAAYVERKDYKAALPYLKQYLDINKRLQGRNNPELLKDYNAVGSLLYTNGEYEEALDYFQKAYDISKSLLPDSTLKPLARVISDVKQKAGIADSEQQVDSRPRAVFAYVLNNGEASRLGMKGSYPILQFEGWNITNSVDSFYVERDRLKGKPKIVTCYRDGKILRRYFDDNDDKVGIRITLQYIDNKEMEEYVDSYNRFKNIDE